MKSILNKIPKQNYLILILVFILILSIMIPSLARYQNRTSINEIEVWDGNVATSYRKGTGTSTDPYIISNGNELAYFASMLKTEDYQNTYFELNNDIVLNDGIFSYDEEGIKYKISNTVFYVKEYTNEIYDNQDYTGSKIKTINLFESLDNFKGYLNGNSYRIYGLYITNQNEEVGLFTNLSGNVSNLYVENAMIYGGNVTAGIATDSTNASLTNILYNGYVVSNNELITKTESYDIPEISSLTEIAIPYIAGNITNVIVKGNITDTILINESEVTGEFSLDLGKVNKITIDTNTLISNLTYEVTYNPNITSGIVANANDTIITNVINKGSIYGKISSGLLGYTNNIDINRAYNSGLLTGDITTGLITKVNGTSNIDKSYSVGTTDYLINDINGTINLKNSFATDTTYLFNNVNETLNIENVYYTSGNIVNEGLVTGPILTDINNLKTKDYVLTNLQFNEFIDNDDLLNNEDNIWIYEEGSYPILAIDDIASPIANIHLGSYTWDNLGYELNTIKLNSSTAFSIEQVDALRPFKEVSYYISDKVLTNAEINNLTWTPYENIVEIKDEGKYVIYAKVVDNNDNIYYLNTDLIILDLSGSDVVINMDDKYWQSLNTPTIKNYINESKDITIMATDNLSGIKSIEYHLAQEVLTEEQLNNVSWNTYSDKVTINNQGTYILYAKVVDNADYVTYVNSEYIIYEGYQINQITTSNNITNNSKMILELSYNSNYQYNDLKTHSIVTNITLPLNTKLTLIDNNKNKVYTYIIDTLTTTYPLTSFSEVGSTNLFDENNYTGQINENFTLMIEFNTVETLENINVAMELNNQDGIIKTLKQTEKLFNIYDSETNITISSNYSNSIIYNSDSTNIIDIAHNINYGMINGQDIIDTTYAEKIIGLNIKLVDSNDNIVAKEYLKNLTFKVNDKEYSPNNDGIVRIADIGNIEITTSIDNSKLLSGTYYIKIKAISSYDGMYGNEYSNEITIPVIVTNNITTDYGFNVDFNNVITDGIVNFDITKTGTFTDPYIRVSLYKKQQLTAYNQDYTLIDLANYTTTSFNKITDNYYTLPQQLELTNMQGGYKFVFELYDGTTKIGTIEKKFIVR